MSLGTLNLDTAYVPREMTLTALDDPAKPSWLVMLCAVPWTVVCDICDKHIVRGDRAYYESARWHPAHVGCWLQTVPARAVRVESVRYH